jgi:hypothetical protein
MLDGIVHSAEHDVFERNPAIERFGRLNDVT